MTNEDIFDKFERENISLAPNHLRFFSFLVDEFIVSFLFLAIYWNQIQVAKTAEEMVLLMDGLIFQIALLKVIYHSFFTWYYGATIGKIIFKIKVISIDLLDNPNLLTSTIRASLRIMSEWILYLGFLWGLLDKNKQTWHDKLARTLVIQNG